MQSGMVWLEGGTEDDLSMFGLINDVSPSPEPIVIFIDYAAFYDPMRIIFLCHELHDGPSSFRPLPAIIDNNCRFMSLFFLTVDGDSGTI